MSTDHDTGNGFAPGVDTRGYWAESGRKGGRPRLPDNARKVPVKIHLTPWLRSAVDAVRQHEEERTGRRPSIGRVLRGLVQLGIDRYRELSRLPEIVR